MIDKIGGLAAQPAVAFAHRSDNGFDRLLAKFLGAGGHTLV